MDHFDDYLANLRNISEINEYLDNQYYYDGVENKDDITEEYILFECYKILIDKLNEIGIILDINENIDTWIADIDWYTLESIYFLYEFIEENNLIKTLKGDLDIITQLESLLCSDIIMSDLLEDFTDLMYVKYENNTDEKFNRIISVTNNFISNDIFYKYLDIIYKEIENTKYDLSIKNPTIINKYLIKKLETRNKLSNIFNKMLSLLDIKNLPNSETINVDYIFKEISLYDNDKLSPENLNMFIMCSIIDDNDKPNDLEYLDRKYLSSDILKKCDSFIINHRKITNHHIEHFIENADVSLTKEDLILLFLSRYDEANNDIIKLQELIKELKVNGTSRLNSQDDHFLDHLLDIVKKIG